MADHLPQLRTQAAHQSQQPDQDENFLERARTEYDRCLRYHHSLTVLALSVNDLNTIKLKYGHKGVSTVQQASQQCCTEELRASDIAGQLGEEFLFILLPETHLPKAEKLAERLIQKNNHAPVQINNRQINYSITIGMASNLQMPIDLHQLLQFAQFACLQAQKSGQPDIVSYHPEPK